MDDSALQLWLALVRLLHKIGRRSAGNLAEFDITPAQFDVLYQLGHSEGLTQQMLADRLLVTRGNVSALLDRMQAQGLLQRHPNPDDARSYILALTEQGRTLLERILPSHLALMTAAFASLAPSEQARLRSTLEFLEHTLE